MGSKIEARERMRAAGVPIVPGVTEPVDVRGRGAPPRRRARLADRDQGVRGGGGQGLKVVRTPTSARARSSRRSARGGVLLGRGRVRRALPRGPAHVEVQVLADAHGNVIHLGERDCTIQRRHQKLVEETPSPAVDDELRERIGAIAVDAARAVGYQSAGTIEGCSRATASTSSSR
jgi:acetyl/propionyl-CoA carboxylase alpha subunit